MHTIRGVVNEALAALSHEFSALYSRSVRPSIPPEQLLQAMLLQAFYSIRSEWQLMERLEFDLLFRWFVGIGVDDAAWDHSTFSKNRERLLEGDIAASYWARCFPAAGEAPAQHGSLLGRRHADRGLGVDEELSAEGRLGPAAGFRRRSEPRSGFPWPEALEPDARFDDRSGGSALSQGAWQGSQALFHGACADGEPQRPRRRLLDRGQRPCRADRGAAHDRAAGRPGRGRSRSAPTRPTTPRTSSMNCAR